MKRRKKKQTEEKSKYVKLSKPDAAVAALVRAMAAAYWKWHQIRCN